MRNLRVAVLVSLLSLLGCKAHSKPAGPTAYDRLQTIPPADPAKFANVRDYKSWKNPYLMVRKDSVGLLDPANSEQHVLKVEQLPDALANLPASAWPYGRAVAVMEEKVKTADDQVLIRKNRGIVAGTLEGANISINWVPAPSAVP